MATRPRTGSAWHGYDIDAGMTIHIGTSGWAYREWRGGFYPPRLKPEEHLAHYVTRFNAVEINGTAYRTPTEETVGRWRDTMPPGFIAAVKLSHAITHARRLHDSVDLLVDFIDSVRHLGDHRGPVLAQLPPGLAPDHVRLRDFLTAARAVMEDESWPLVVEFRHRDWLSERTTEVLARGNATWCVADMPVCPVLEPPSDTNVLYLRRHGTTGRYRGSYDDAALQRDADRLCRWSGRGAQAFAFFNNTADGAAVWDAHRLHERVTACLGRAEQPADGNLGTSA